MSIPSHLSIPEISVEALAERLAEPIDSLQLLDVREPQEVAIAQLREFENLPLSDFSVWSVQIDRHLNPQQETIVLCHHGIRSAQVCRWLLQQGFANVKNVAGGIHAYAVKVDPTVPCY
ncbi:MAG TPA: rhodanese-like domain-containing protein [Candidatus Caenarcaniphilales bacterium]